VTEDGIREAFIDGLNSIIRIYLIVCRDIDDLSTLIKSALAIEESLNIDKERENEREKEKEKPRYRRTPTTTLSSKSAFNNWRSPLSNSTKEVKQTCGPTPSGGPSRPKYSNKEHARRYMEGECFGCGRKDHVQKKCPLKFKREVTVNLLDFSEEEINEGRQCSSVLPIIVPIEVDGHKGLPLADSGAGANLLQDKVMKRTSLRPQFAKNPSLLQQAISKEPVVVNQELLARVNIPSQGIHPSKPSVFKIAPISHEAILGICKGYTLT
jgi:hypothetical protein